MVEDFNEEFLMDSDVLTNKLARFYEQLSFHLLGQ